MSARRLVKKLLSVKTSEEKNWVPVSMMVRFVREKDMVTLEEKDMDVLVQPEKPSAVAQVEESVKAVIASEAVKSDIIDIKDYEGNSETENTKTKKDNTTTKAEPVIYL